MQQKLIINRLYSAVCHLSSVICRRPSTTVESALQIRPFYAKQTQFAESPNERKSI